MAFSNVGPLIGLPPGGTYRWAYTWGTTNMGMQLASADVKTPNNTPHVAYDQEKQINPDGTVWYFVTIRNNGTQWAWHNLTGGGMV